MDEIKKDRTGPTTIQSLAALVVGMLMGWLLASLAGCARVHGPDVPVSPDAATEAASEGRRDGLRLDDAGDLEGANDAGVASDGARLEDGALEGGPACVAAVSVACPAPAPSNLPGELTEPSVWRFVVPVRRSTCQGDECTYRCAWLDVPDVEGWQWYSWGLGIATCAGAGQPLAPGRYGYPLAPRYGSGLSDDVTWTLEARPTVCSPPAGPPPVLEVGAEYSGTPHRFACL